MSLFVAQMADPLRIVLVIAALWVVKKLYDEGERTLPYIVGMVGVAIVVSLILASTSGLPRQSPTWAIVTAFGFVSNLVIWAIWTGVVWAYRRITTG